MCVDGVVLIVGGLYYTDVTCNLFRFDKRWSTECVVSRGTAIMVIGDCIERHMGLTYVPVLARGIVGYINVCLIGDGT